MFGMKEDHRQRLRKNRVALLKSMMLSEDLFSILMEDSTLTEDMVQTIQVSSDLINGVYYNI